MPLGLRWGTVTAVARAPRRARPARGRRRALRRLPAADRAGRGRRRGARQRPGARARARLGRLRRPLREPDAGPRAAGGDGRARDEAPVHAGPASPRASRRRTRRDAARSGSTACRSSAARLHSQLAPVCAALAGRRVAYVQLAGGALPVSLSDTVRALKARRLLDDGDRRRAVPRRRRRSASPSAAALDAGRGRGADVVVCAIGPGIVGTGVAAGPRRPRRRGGGERRGGARRRADRGAARVRRRRRGSGTAGSRTTRARRSRSASGDVRVAWPPASSRRQAWRCVEVERRGLGGRVRGAAALAHGPRARRGSRGSSPPRSPPGRLAAGLSARSARRCCIVPARREDRRRQGDQAARVPRRADAGRRARARPARPRGRRRDGRGRRQRASPTRPTTAVGARLATVDEVWAASELLLKVKEPIEPEYARLREGLDPLHLPPHRRRRAADAGARRRAASPASRTRRSRPTTARCRCSRR